jgi:hypothetical protein
MSTEYRYYQDKQTQNWYNSALLVKMVSKIRTMVSKTRTIPSHERNTFYSRESQLSLTRISITLL